MIRALTLENYRSFEEYRIRDLASVNLVVGPNNCGKTSLLEAIELFVLGGSPTAMLKSGSCRGESTIHDSGDSRRSRYAVRHLFHGHATAPGAPIRISRDDGPGSIEILVREMTEGDASGLFASGISEEDLRSGLTQPMVLEVRADPVARPQDARRVFPLMADGSLDWRSEQAHRYVRDLSKGVAIRFLTTDSGRSPALGRAWDRVVMERREHEVVDAMRIIAPELRSIHFLTDHASERRMGFATSGVLLGMRGGGPRVPIGSHGEGMRRLLALALALVETTDGWLLVDEIDTGLHWTAMEGLWKLVIETAARASTQVFATTHSLDCILGLARLLKARPDLHDAVSIQKIERQLDHSVSFDAEGILAAADLGIELR